VGEVILEIIFKRVDLPEPLLPINTIFSPCKILKLRSFRAIIFFFLNL